MISKYFKIMKVENCDVNKNFFKKKNIYNDLIKYKNNFSVCYISYIKDENSDDRLVYSMRKNEAMLTTWYNLEQTNICKITENSITDNKELINHNNISHNLSLCNIDNKIIGYGGVYSTALSRNSKNQQGIFSFLFSKEDITKIKLTIPKNITIKTTYVTAFDSNVTFLKHNDLFYLYTRYNQTNGVRKTQLLTSKEYDNNFKVEGIVSFNDPTVFSYMQNIFVENGIFIGIFRIYRKKNFNTHHIYNNSTKINYLVAHSFNGLDFIIDNENFLEDINIYDMISSNHKKYENKKSFFFSRTYGKDQNIIKEYEIRKGGYINYKPICNSNECKLYLEIQDDNKENILLNYIIDNEGFINIFFIDKNDNILSKKEIKNKNSTNNKIKITKNSVKINIIFYKSKIYQIL